MLENGNVVQTNVALQVPDAPGLMIPRGTSGRISRVIDGRVSLVHWEVNTHRLSGTVSPVHTEEFLML